MKIIDQNSTDMFFIKKALTLAQKALSLGEVPVGAVAVLNQTTIGEGFNCPIKNSDMTAHAEIIALRQAATKLQNYRLPAITLYVTLEPCLMCTGAIIQARIKRLVFGAYDHKTGAITSAFNLAKHHKLNHKVNFTGGILENECGKILSNFFQQKRKETSKNSCIKMA